MMKRPVLLFLVLVVVCFSLTATFNAVVDVTPYFTFDNTPSGIEGLDWKQASGLQVPSWWETKQDFWYDAFSKPSFMNLGFTLDTDNVDMVVLVDFMQDIFLQIRDRAKLLTNVPFINGANLDLTFPRVGYLDFTSSSGNLYLSLGRRQIKWGPGTWGMALSDAQPYLDNLYLNVGSDIGGSWRFGYDFVALAFKHYLDIGVVSDGAPQTTFAHRFTFGCDSFRISMTELNNIYGKMPTLVDCTPRALWHNNYQDDCSNVMVDLALEGRVGSVRVFGSLALDDFLLSGEPNTNPTAIGASAGIEMHLVPGEAFGGRDFSNSLYAIKDETFHEEGGLNLSYEFYFCSTFMYNRAVKAGKFTSSFQVNSNVGPKKFYDEDAFFLGFRYGPSTRVHLFSASYETARLGVTFSAQLLSRGSYYIDSVYDDDAKSSNDPFFFTPPVTDVLSLESTVRYCPQPGLNLVASVSFTRDITHRTSAFKACAGVEMAVCDIDWKNL